MGSLLGYPAILAEEKGGSRNKEQGKREMPEDDVSGVLGFLWKSRFRDHGAELLQGRNPSSAPPLLFLALSHALSSCREPPLSSLKVRWRLSHRTF